MPSQEYTEGWQAAVAQTRPPQMLTVDAANELLNRCEKAFDNGPNNKVVNIQVPAEMLHELIVCWKIARK
jgi:hypothetical protein